MQLAGFTCMVIGEPRARPPLLGATERKRKLTCRFARTAMAAASARLCGCSVHVRRGDRNWIGRGGPDRVVLSDDWMAVAAGMDGEQRATCGLACSCSSPGPREAGSELLINSKVLD